MLLLEARDGPRASGLVVCGDVEPAFSTPILSKALIGVAMAVNTIRETKKCSKNKEMQQGTHSAPAVASDPVLQMCDN